VSEIEGHLNVLLGVGGGLELSSLPTREKHDKTRAGGPRTILVLTQERLHLLANALGAAFKIDLLVVDEAHMLRKYDVGDKVSANDVEVLRSALALHPDVTAKVGLGITHFSVRSADFGTKCFWVIQRTCIALYRPIKIYQLIIYVR
jgi:uncharacterized protein DUF3223